MTTVHSRAFSFSATEHPGLHQRRPERDPIAQSALDLLPILNKRYGSTLEVLCRHFAHVEQVRDPRIIDIDSQGCTLEYHRVGPSSPPGTAAASAKPSSPLTKSPVVPNGPQQVRIVFRNPLQDEDDIPASFTDLFDEARTGIVSQTMSQVPAHKQVPFVPPAQIPSAIILILLTALVHMIVSSQPISPLAEIRNYLTQRIVNAIGLFALAAHIFEMMAAGMTCVVVLILAPGYMTRTVAAKYIVGTFFLGFPVISELLRNVKEVLDDESSPNKDN
ncbi:hypothetical protein H4R33_006526 [Dimargaris cristalligena]|nr:hypothetical protein H4R33_006526 [Dimargaris cristalligena]